MAKRVSLAESVKQAGAKAATVKVTFVLEEPIYNRLQHVALDAKKSNRTVLTEAIRRSAKCHFASCNPSFP